MDKLNTYTSTGNKFISHFDVIKRLEEKEKATPISLQIAPTSICNLKCSFCSNVNRSKHESLDPNFLMELLVDLKNQGLKAIEWTGGGDPTCYPYINELIMFADGLGLEQGMITNGTLLTSWIQDIARNCLLWIRVSMNCLDYVDDIDLSDIKSVLGFSYVMNRNTTAGVLLRLNEYVQQYDPEYVRIVPDCQCTLEEQEKNNREIPESIKDLGDKYIYQPKVFQKPERCWWGFFKPFLLHDGWIYPCSSVVLNDDSERSFHEKYRWVKAENLIDEKYDQMIHQAHPFDPSRCDHCVFTAQNNLVDAKINPGVMRNFI